MSLPGKRLGLAAKLALPVGLAWIVAGLGLYFFHSWQLENQGREDLAARLSAFADSKAAELTEPVWDFSSDLVERLMHSYRTTEDLAGATLFNAKGEMLFRIMKSAPADPGLVAERSLVRRSGGEDYRVGRLLVEFSSARLERSLAQRRQEDLLALALFTVVLGGAAWLAARRMVGRPLRRLEQSLHDNARQGRREPLRWDSHDELGQVAAAYNALLGEVERQTRDLELANAALRAEVAQRAAAEAELSLAATVFAVAAEGVAITDHRGVIHTVNQAFTRITGYAAEEVVGRDIRRFKPALRGADPLENIWRLAEEHCAWSGESWSQRKDGRAYPEWLRLTWTPDPGGGPCRMVMVFADITERKQAEAALLRSREELERQVEERTRELTAANQQLRDLDRQRLAFLSSASHELRTPLTSVLGYAKLVRRHFSRSFAPLARGRDRLERKAAAIRNGLEVMAQEGERLTRLINDLLDLNRIEAGQAPWRDADLDPAREIARAARTLGGALAARPGLRLELDLDPGLPPLRMDRDRLQQVLLNLLGNAAKFTPSGLIRVRAACPAPGRLRIDVEDSGPGVAAPDRERIFEKFFQAGALDPDAAKPQGAGLGLAICKQIVEHYQGRIWAESSPRGGSFSLELPLAPPPPPPLSGPLDA